jgi:hypothetical protein
MIYFIRLILFSKTVLLTPVPIDLTGEVELVPTKPLTAITPGAALEIDVSSTISRRREIEGILEFDKRLAGEFPDGSIQAILTDTSAKEVLLSFTGKHAYAGESVFLILNADGDVPTESEFTKVVIKTEREIHSVLVYWRNFKH